MAGVFFMLERATLADGRASGKVVFKAFVRASVSLSILGIIQFKGLIYIALGYAEDGSNRYAIGEAEVSVSIKIGFIRFSYSFVATHVDKSGGAAPAQLLVAPETGGMTPTLPASPANAPFVFDQFNADRRDAFDRLIASFIWRPCTAELVLPLHCPTLRIPRSFHVHSRSLSLQQFSSKLACRKRPRTSGRRWGSIHYFEPTPRRFGPSCGPLTRGRPTAIRSTGLRRFPWNVTSSALSKEVRCSATLQQYLAGMDRPSAALEHDRRFDQLAREHYVDVAKAADDVKEVSQALQTQLLSRVRQLTGQPGLAATDVSAVTTDSVRLGRWLDSVTQSALLDALSNAEDSASLNRRNAVVATAPLVPDVRAAVRKITGGSPVPNTSRSSPVTASLRSVTTAGERARWIRVTSM